jgi:hypothetical protein
MRTIKFNIDSGGSSLLMHNGWLVDDLNPYTQRLAELTVRRRSRGVDKLEVSAEMSRVEWEGGLYYDDKVGPYIPAHMIRASIICGAKQSRGGAACQRAMQVLGAKFPLEYDGPRDMEELWDDKSFVDRRPVTIGRVKVMRSRPLFSDWSLEFTVAYNEDGLSREDLIRYVYDAGIYHGFGDGRKINYGRFVITHIDDKSVDEDLAAAA